MRRLILATILAGAWYSGVAAQKTVPAEGTQTVSSRTVPLDELPGALASSASGDTIVVSGGHLTTEALTIDKAITLIGIGRPVLDGDGQSGLLMITADSVSVSGFVFRHTGITFMDDRAAIRVEGASGCSFTGNTFEETFFGLYLAGASDCRVEDNRFVATPDREVNGGNAIHAWYSSGLWIAGNEIQGHRDGIYLEFTDDSTVTGNRSTGNSRYGLHFMFSDRCRYDHNTFRQNGAGVAVMYASEVDMHGNLFADAWSSSSYGLLLKEIKGGRVGGNRFAGNAIGLFVESSDRIEFAANRFSENGWAIKIMADATGNRFTENVFEGNTFDVSTNSRNVSGSEFAGNYWDRYDGYDLDRDGFGDVPFHPVRLFAVVVEQHEPALVLLRSVLVDVLDAAESVLPFLTPSALVDSRPLIRHPSL